ncbi:MAG: DUF4339 domain-containing protein [Candidatus Omnitrophica bacterium]|nr:DUF4339 domain-containing protein [Candidatus Omnitrophota bacterium]
MAHNYFFGKNNQKIGPFDKESIQKQISEGQIHSQMLAWCEGMDSWKPACQVPELTALFQEGTQPPPLPGESQTPPPLPGTEIPAGLSPLEEQAYRFAAAIFRPWRGKHSPLGAYVRKNPKNAVYVSLGTIIVMIAFVIMVAYSFSPDQQQGQDTAQGQQQLPMNPMMPPAGWQAQHRAMMDAQRETSRISDEVYTYRRDRQDKMDDLRREVTYDLDD